MPRFTRLCSSMLPSPQQTHHHSPVPLHKTLHFKTGKGEQKKKKKQQLARTWCNLSMMEHWADPQLCIQGTVQCDTVGVSSPQLCICNRVHSSTMRWCELATVLHAYIVQCSVTWWAWACAPSTGSTHNRHSKNTQWCLTARSRIAQSYNSAPEVPRLARFLLLVFNLVTALNSLKNSKLSNSSASCQNRWWETKS